MSKYFILCTFALCAVLFGGCQDKKTVQENAQLKTQVLGLQKQLGDMGNQIQELTKARDDLTKQNAALSAENNRLKGRASKKTVKAKKHHKHSV
jgi:regulator of replication initiation timing